MNYLVFVLLIKMISGFEDINLDMYKNSKMYETWTDSISFITNVGESSQTMYSDFPEIILMIAFEYNFLL